MELINLLSDTVTKPTAGMLKAMFAGYGSKGISGSYEQE